MQAGTVVYEDLAINDVNNYHLTSVETRSGTSTPVEYRILEFKEEEIKGCFKKFKGSKESLASLSYDLCHNYPNWQGAIRVPVVLQAANKHAKFHCEHLPADVKLDKTVKTVAYFY